MIGSRAIGSVRLNSLTCLVRPVTQCTPSSISRCVTARCLSSSSPFNNKSEAMPIPTPEGAPKVYPSKIENLVTQISQLTLLEVADLNSALKERLNIPDAAPVSAFPAGMMMAAPAQEEEEINVVKQVQTSFAVKLTGFDVSKKVAVIKYIKSCIEGYNLVQAKKFVENLPALVKSDLGKDEADKLKEELAALGAESEIE